MRLPGAFDAAGSRLLASWLFLLVTSIEAASVTPRYLVYPPPASGAPTKVQLIFGLGLPMEVDVSTIVGYVMKCNYNLPYNASYLPEPYYSRRRRSTPAGAAVIDGLRKSRAKAGSDEDVDGGGGAAAASLGRYEIYKMVESAIDSAAARSGRGCLLRAICEAALTPLNARDGLTAQLLHIFLTPSSTAEVRTAVHEQEYLAAESIGRSAGADCGRTFPECAGNLLEYLSRIH